MSARNPATGALGGQASPRDSVPTLAGAWDFSDLPPALLCDTKFCREIIHALLQLAQKRPVDGIAPAGAPHDGQSAQQVDLGRQHATASLEGDIEVSAPLAAGEVERRGQRSTIHFRASLRLGIEPMADGRDERSDQGAEPEGAQRTQPTA